MENKKIFGQYHHTAVGERFIKASAAVTKFCMKHLWFYYLISCTWGILMTLFGALVTAGLGIAKLFNKKIKFEKYGPIYAIKVAQRWGGMEAGLMFVRDTTSAKTVNSHELGHTFQNVLLGPLFVFVVAIPSAIRWWIRRLQPTKEHPAYDSVWFEDAATQCGKWAIEYWEEKHSKRVTETIEYHEDKTVVKYKIHDVTEEIK